MSKGFITLGIDTEKDRIFHSYALAYSIKHSDPKSQTCLVVDKGKSDLVPKDYLEIFDYIVELPFGNSAHVDGFHGMNIWQMFHCSPFDETIYVDSDTLLHNIDIDLLWDTLSSKGDFAVPQNALSYRNYSIDNTHRFEFESLYNLPKFFNNMIYWKKDAQLSLEWFKMADPIMQNWRSAYNRFFTDKKPTTFDKNILCNLVTHCLDVQNEIGVLVGNHFDLHADCQGVWTEDLPKEWTEMLNYWISANGKIQIENHIITSGIIHYCDENFLTDEVIDVYRSS
tara:strand:+ start:255 stop:1103 length:849 start_codon:yes stop_codon:yes gene_type:complete